MNGQGFNDFIISSDHIDFNYKSCQELKRRNVTDTELPETNQCHVNHNVEAIGTGNNVITQPGFNDQCQHMDRIQQSWDRQSHTATRWSIQEQVQLVNYVRSFGKLNVLGARVRINYVINFELAEDLATSASDREVLQYLMYGWPLNHDGRPVAITLENHATALQFPEHIAKYINKEIGLNCLLGPFITIPWDSSQVAVSPMSTRAKKQSNKRRVIMDLSWPLDGTLVNDGIPGDKYMEQLIQIRYPTVDDLCKQASKLGTNCRGWKWVLDRAFKQWNFCPFDWPLQGITWNGWLFFDKTTLMGCRSAPYCCQRVTSFIRHILRNLQHFVLNYVDDFMGLDTETNAWMAYQTLGNLLRDLGIDESLEKAIPPSEIVEFLGVLFNLREMTMSVTSERMQEFKEELDRWYIGKKYTKKQLERLLGKMQFVSNCVRPARVFVFQLRNTLRQIKDTAVATKDMQLDVEWWKNFLPKYNGVSIMWMAQKVKADCVIASDSCLTGMGAHCGTQYIASKFPEIFLDQTRFKIHHLEMIAVLVTLRKWKHKLTGIRFVMWCDNQIVVEVVNSGYTRDVVLQTILRELVMLAAIWKFEVILQYITSRDNRISDVLSQVHLGGKYVKMFKETIPENWEKIQLQSDDFD